MLNIVIIGCGNIGSRHLQALAHLEEEGRILLIDPSLQNRLQALERFRDVEVPNKVFQHKIEDADSLPSGERWDLALVATNSKVRADVVRGLLECSEVEHLILEKFLFQLREDYDEIGCLIGEKAVPTWVNHWITDTYAYNRAARRVIRGRPFSMEVFGEGWGLCCNAVHHLEFFDGLCGRPEIELTKSDLESSLLPSKRPGYVEIDGRIDFRSITDGSSLGLECRGENVNFANINTRIRAGDDSVELTLRFSELEAVFKVEGRTWRETFAVLPQSRRTQKVVHDIMTRGTCGIPTYERSRYQHLLVYDLFRDHIRSLRPEVGDLCPVT